MNLVLLGAAHRGKAVDLVEEDDARLHAASLLEEEAQLPLGFPHPLGQAVCALAHEERHVLPAVAALVGQGARHERLAGPGGSEEEDAARGLHVKVGKDLGVEKREGHHLLQRLHVVLQPPHAAPVHIRVHPHWLRVDAHHLAARRTVHDTASVNGLDGPQLRGLPLALVPREAALLAPRVVGHATVTAVARRLAAAVVVGAAPRPSPVAASVAPPAVAPPPPPTPPTTTTTAAATTAAATLAAPGRLPRSAGLVSFNAVKVCVAADGRGTGGAHGAWDLIYKWRQPVVRRGRRRRRGRG